MTLAVIVELFGVEFELSGGSKKEHVILIMKIVWIIMAH